MSIKVAQKCKILTPLQKSPKNVGKIIVPQALKSCPKCNKSPNLVTLSGTDRTKMKHNRGRDQSVTRFGKISLLWSNCECFLEFFKVSLEFGKLLNLPNLLMGKLSLLQKAKYRTNKIWSHRGQSQQCKQVKTMSLPIVVSYARAWSSLVEGGEGSYLPKW